MNNFRSKNYLSLFPTSNRTFFSHNGSLDSTSLWQTQISRPNVLYYTAVQCPALQHPANGQVQPRSCLLADENEFKGSCVYSCDEGYSMVGASFVSCQASGRWSAEPPVCREGKGFIIYAVVWCRGNEMTEH